MLVKVRTLKPGDKIKMDEKTEATVASLEWTDDLIHHEKTTRAMKLCLKGGIEMIVAPSHLIDRP